MFESVEGVIFFKLLNMVILIIRIEIHIKLNWTYWYIHLYHIIYLRWREENLCVSLAPPTHMLWVHRLEIWRLLVVQEDFTLYNKWHQMTRILHLLQGNKTESPPSPLHTDLKRQQTSYLAIIFHLKIFEIQFYD